LTHRQRECHLTFLCVWRILKKELKLELYDESILRPPWNERLNSIGAGGSPVLSLDSRDFKVATHAMKQWRQFDAMDLSDDDKSRFAMTIGMSIFDHHTDSMITFLDWPFAIHSIPTHGIFSPSFDASHSLLSLD
jgi:hypothetical protein